MYLSSILLVLLDVSILLGTTSADVWSYTNRSTDTETWGEHFKLCDGMLQSPINIVQTNTRLNSNLKPINITKSDADSSTTYEVVNNGHSVQIDFPEKMWRISLRDTEQPEYCAKQMHFHWGSTSNEGSEHTLDGQSYSLEAHLVLYNCHIYESFSKAAASPIGLAVLGFWGQETPDVENNQTMFGVLGQMENELQSEMTPKQKVQIPWFDLSKLLDLVNSGSYFRYEGSLTTPPCTPNVIWTVFTDVIPVLPDHLQGLRSQRFSAAETQKNMFNNFRPVQPVSTQNSLVPRIIYRSFGVPMLANNILIIASLVLYQLKF